MRLKMADGTEQDVYYNGVTGAEMQPLRAPEAREWRK